MIRIRSIKAVKPRITIGIMGYEPGMGVTYLAVALANYIAGWLHARTALVEFEERDALGRLSDTGVDESFRINGVDYYPAVSADELAYILNGDYEYIILDLGVDRPGARAELLRCSGKLIVGSLCPWRRAVYYDYIQRLLNKTGNSELYTFLAIFESKIEIKRCRRTCKAQVKSIPFIANPFEISEKDIPFLHSLI